MSDGTGWHVTNQQQESNLGDNNRFIPGVRVFFASDDGIASSVWVPNADFTPDTVRDVIVAQLAVQRAVQQLSG